MEGTKDFYLNPFFHSSNFRSEFKLPSGKVFLKDVVLQNLGFSKTGVTETPFYNPILGGLGVIKSIVLTNNGVEIDGCKNCNILTGFKNVLGNPSSNHAKKDRNISADVQPRIIIARKADGSFEKEGCRVSYDRIDRSALALSQKITENADAGIPLSYFLPVLDALGSVDTTVLQDLRIRIEYVGGDGTLTTDKDDSVAVSLTPVLKMKEIEDDKLMSQMKYKNGSTNWVTYEHDRFGIAASAGGTIGLVNETHVRLSGLRNKYIGRVLITKNLVDGAATGMIKDHFVYGEGNVGSFANFKEKIQIRVNGRNLFPEGGVGGLKSSELTAMCVDTWGDYSCIPYGNEYGMGPGAYNADSNTWPMSLSVNQVGNGRRAYIGFSVQQMAQDFHIEYSRVSVAGEVAATTLLGASGYTNLAQTGNVYYETFKQIVIKDGQVAVSYANPGGSI